MTIISSQHYIDQEIARIKKEELAASSATLISIPCWDIGEIDGIAYAIQADGHHTLHAARELGLEVEYQIADEPEGLTGEDALDARWMDGDWFRVATSNPGAGEIDFVW